MPPELFPGNDETHGPQGWHEADYKVTIGVEAKQNETLYLPFEIKGHDGTVEDLQISFYKAAQLMFIGDEHDIATASMAIFPDQPETQCWNQTSLNHFNSHSDKFSGNCSIVAVDEDAGRYKAVVASYLLRQAAGGIFSISFQGMENDFNRKEDVSIPTSYSAGGWTYGNEGFVQQTFLGASIRSFSINGGFGDSTSTLSVSLVNDEYNVSDRQPQGFGDDVYHTGSYDKFSPPIVGTPVWFKFGKNRRTVVEEGS